MTSLHSAEEINPDPAQLVESLRDFGYTLPTALADLVDNSLTAEAKSITIVIDSGVGSPKPHIAVLDNGRGMDRETLVNAMRMGSVSPLNERRENDLGRFGLGLKTASLSQGRTVTVISRTKGAKNPLVRCWNIEHIREVGWKLSDELTVVAKPYYDQVQSLPRGTAIVVEDLDRPAFLRAHKHDVHEHLGHAINDVRKHLAMVFHRFIQDGVKIYLGSTALTPWDPFLSAKSQELPQEKLRLRSSTIAVQPFVLPHHSKLTDTEYDLASGPFGWNAQQGFYIYRCRRLIVSGTWLNLPFQKEEHYKLARIRIDLPNSVDSDWHLNVMKSHIAVPAFLRDDLLRIASTTRKSAVEVYRFRGERSLPKDHPPQRVVWKREQTRSGVRYRVDRTHPILRALLHSGCEHDRLLEQVIEIIEKSVPISHMLQEPPKALDGSVDCGTSSLPIDELVGLATHVEQFLVRAGIAPKTARQTVLAADPFVWHREAILQKITN